MIEITGLVFGDQALTASITETGESTPDFRHYQVRLAVRDGDGDHLYQRALYNVSTRGNILAVLQTLLDELPEEAFTASALWMPGRHNKMRLELPPT